MSDTQIKIIAVGDIAFGEHPMKYHHGVRSAIDENIDIFSSVHAILKSGDIVFGNLENVLSNRSINKDIRKDFFRGCPTDVQILSSNGFNIVNLSNNHIFDHGIEALDDTLSLLDANKIAHVGIDKKTKDFTVEIKKLEIKGKQIGFIGVIIEIGSISAYKPVPKLDELIKKIQSERSNYDYLILSIHWGYEYMNKPSLEQQLIGHKLIDAGIDFIIGHHPHVWQPIERYKKGIIAYSLGNFIFDYTSNTTSVSNILEIQIDENFKMFIHPVKINKFGQPIVYDSKIELCPQETLPLKTSTSKEFQATLYDEKRDAKKCIWKTLLINFWKYDLKWYRWIIKKLMTKKTSQIKERN